MKDKASPAIVSCLIFPVAPIVVIIAISILCKDIWQAVYYPTGEDGGEVEPAMALIVIPLLLIVLAVALSGMTALNRWVVQHFAPGNWWRLAIGIPRMLFAGVSLLLFLVSAGFFIGDLTAIGHWQVICAWIASLAVVTTFVTQQYRRL
jgi:hypothetical protein